MKQAQLYFQFSFRGQTPNNGNKHWCYVFDFNPNRSLTMLYALAKAQAGNNDPKPILQEMLEVFNVLCYEGNGFNAIDPSSLIAKLEAGFGRASSLTGIQSLLSGFIDDFVDFDDEFCAELDEIDDGSAQKIKELEVNSSEVANGKNSKSVPNDEENAEQEKAGDESDKSNNANSKSKIAQQRLKAQKSIGSIAVILATYK